MEEVGDVRAWVLFTLNLRVPDTLEDRYSKIMSWALSPYEKSFLSINAFSDSV